jgi:hypothetical protein
MKYARVGSLLIIKNMESILLYLLMIHIMEIVSQFSNRYFTNIFSNLTGESYLSID